MNEAIGIGVAGLGTVGQGVLKILDRHRDLLSVRTGRPIEIKAVCARSRTKDRGLSIDEFDWEDDPVVLAKRDDVDIFVELIGGEDGPAKAAVQAALRARKDVVTANKAMLALHGQALSEYAERVGSCLRFEPAVAGGIPVVKALTEGMAANSITRVMGIMNGTCNYILTRMEREHLGYEEVFSEARALGYVEADPTLDVGGIDAAHKLALLASIAFGTKLDFASMEIEGIDRISINDIEQAADMGFKVKLLGAAKLHRDGLEQRTQPCLVPADSPLGKVDGATNIVVLEGDSVGQVYLQGAGAGEGPTASAVVSDIVDIARGRRISTFGQPANTLLSVKPVKSNSKAPYYIRLSLEDKPGVLARIASAIGNADVSINRMRQYGHDTKAAPVIIVTHHTTRRNLDKALGGIRESGVSLAEPVALRIEEV